MQPSRGSNPRRRGRPNSPDNHSQGFDEASSASSSQAADSMRPLAPPARKRRRTILDAFQSIHIQNEEEEDADSSQAVADIEGEDVSDSTIEDEESQDDRLLSDREEAERKVMLELVLGPAKKKGDPVDQKVASMVRQTMQQVATTSTGMAAPSSSTTASITTSLPAAAKDDMHIEAPYSRSSVPAHLLAPTGPGLERSNSLPDMSSLDSDAMEISMT